MGATVRTAKAVRRTPAKPGAARDKAAEIASCKAQLAELRTLIRSKTEAQMVAEMTPEERADYDVMRRRMRILHMTDKELMKLYYDMKRERYRR